MKIHTLTEDVSYLKITYCYCCIKSFEKYAVLKEILGAFFILFYPARWLIRLNKIEIFHLILYNFL